MKLWLKILIITVILPYRVFSNIDKFEGKIKIVKESIYDTLRVEVSIKDNIVRIDEINSRNTIQQSYLIDLTKEKMYALSIKDKLYAEIPLRPASKVDQNTEFIKTANCMEINGELCYQWRVRNKSKNSELTYWVAQRNYGFMKSLISIIRRSDIPFEMLSQFPEINGYMPLLSVERTLLRKVKMSARVIDIVPAKLPENLFTIPPGYRELLG